MSEIIERLLLDVFKAMVLKFGVKVWNSLRSSVRAEKCLY